MDVHDSAIRSYNMSRIRSKDTKSEIVVRKFLYSSGYRYRLHDKKLPGKPDIVLPRYKTVIDVRGCFWHGHENCRYAVIPQSRREWWLKKIQKTIERDGISVHLLEKLGWNVIIVWECSLKKENFLLELIDKLKSNETRNSKIL